MELLWWIVTGVGYSFGS